MYSPRSVTQTPSNHPGFQAGNSFTFVIQLGEHTPQAPSTTVITIPYPSHQTGQEEVVETESLSPRREKKHKVKKEKRPRRLSTPSKMEITKEETSMVYFQTQEGEKEAFHSKRNRSITPPPRTKEHRVEKNMPHQHDDSRKTNIHSFLPIQNMPRHQGSGIHIPKKNEEPDPVSPRLSTSPREKSHWYQRPQKSPRETPPPLIKMRSQESGLQHISPSNPYALPPLSLGRDNKTSPRKELVQPIVLQLPMIYKEIYSKDICDFVDHYMPLCRTIDTLLHKNLTSKEPLDETFRILQAEICHEGKLGPNIANAWKFIVNQLRISTPRMDERIRFIFEMINRSGETMDIQSPFREDTTGFSLYAEFTKRRLEKFFTRGCFTECALRAIHKSIEPNEESNPQEIDKRLNNMTVLFLKNLSDLFCKSKKPMPNTIRALNHCILENIRTYALSTNTSCERILLERFLFRIITPELLELAPYFQEKKITGFEPITSDLLSLAVKMQKILSNLPKFKLENKKSYKKIKKYLENIKKFFTKEPEELHADSSPDDMPHPKTPRGKNEKGSVRNLKELVAQLNLKSGKDEKDKEKEI